MAERGRSLPLRPYPFLSCGESELLPPNRGFAAVPAKQHLQYEFHVVPGGHKWTHWNQQLSAMFERLGQRVGASPSLSPPASILKPFHSADYIHEAEIVRSIRLAKTLSWLTAGVALAFFDRAFHRWVGMSSLYALDLVILLALTIFSYAYLVLSYVGKLDPVVAWAARAWQRADYKSAIFRVWLFSWAGRRAPFTSFLLTSANLADRAYAVAANSTLPDTDMEDPTYDLNFASGRAALAQGQLDRARHHFARLYQRFPGSALARYAFADFLLWQNTEIARAHQLLAGALADSARFDLPHWKRLGLEAELHASHAWSVALMNKPEALQDSLDKPIRLAGRNRPVLAAVHLRLGFALRALHHPITARQHWDAAREIDPHGWAGVQAARELQNHVEVAS